MKRIIKMMHSLAVVAVVSLVLTGCGVQSPSAVVEATFKQIAKGESGNMSQYLLGALADETATETEEQTELSDAQKQVQDLFFSQFSGKVLSETIDGETASVAVEMTSLNMAEIILSAMGAAMGAAFSGTELTDEAVDQIMLEQFETAEVQTRTGNVSLEKIDGQWKIDTASDDFATLIFGEIDLDK